MSILDDLTNWASEEEEKNVKPFDSFGAYDPEGETYVSNEPAPVEEEVPYFPEGFDPNTVGSQDRHGIPAVGTRGFERWKAENRYQANQASNPQMYHMGVTEANATAQPIQTTLGPGGIPMPVDGTINADPMKTATDSEKTEYGIGMGDAMNRKAADKYLAYVKQGREDARKRIYSIDGRPTGNVTFNSKGDVTGWKEFSPPQYAKNLMGESPERGVLEVFNEASELFQGYVWDKLSQIPFPTKDYERDTRTEGNISLGGSDRIGGTINETIGNIEQGRIEEAIAEKGTTFQPPSLPGLTPSDDKDAPINPRDFYKEPTYTPEEQEYIDQDNKGFIEQGVELAKEVYTNRKAARDLVRTSGPAIIPTAVMEATGAGVVGGVANIYNKYKNAIRLSKAGKRGAAVRSRVIDQMKRSEALQKYTKAITREGVIVRGVKKVGEEAKDAAFEVIYESLNTAALGGELDITAETLLDGMANEVAEEIFVFGPVKAVGIGKKALTNPSELNPFSQAPGVTKTEADMIAEHMAGGAEEIDLATATKDAGRIAQDVQLPILQNESTKDMKFKVTPEARELRDQELETALQDKDLGYSHEKLRSEAEAAKKNVKQKSAYTEEGQTDNVSPYHKVRGQYDGDNNTLTMTGDLGNNLEGVAVEELVHSVQDKIKGTELDLSLKKWERKAAEEYANSNNGEAYGLSGDELSAQSIAQAITGTENTPGVSQFRVPDELSEAIREQLPAKWRTQRGRDKSSFQGKGYQTENKFAGNTPNAQEFKQVGTGNRFSLEGYKGEYPLAPKSEWWGDADYEKRGGEVKTMTPDEYLNQVKPLNKNSEMTIENVDDLAEHVSQGRTLDPPVIYKDGKEDGRHRALMAKKLGIKEIPVIDFRKTGSTKSDLDRTGTPQFRKWFGDSKVVNKDGTPKVVYHGAESYFTEFDSEDSIEGVHFFSDDIKTSQTYTLDNSKKDTVGRVESGDLKDLDPDDKANLPSTYHTYLKMENPLVVDADYSAWDEVSFEGKSLNTTDLVKIAKSRGYDGLAIKDVYDQGQYGTVKNSSDVYAVFDNTGIKSVSNEGSFNPKNKDIRFNLQRNIGDIPGKERRRILNKRGETADSLGIDAGTLNKNATAERVQQALEYMDSSDAEGPTYNTFKVRRAFRKLRSATRDLDIRRVYEKDASALELIHEQGQTYMSMEELIEELSDNPFATSAGTPVNTETFDPDSNKSEKDIPEVLQSRTVQMLRNDPKVPKSMPLENWKGYLEKAKEKGVGTPEELKLSGFNVEVQRNPKKKMTSGNLANFFEENVQTLVETNTAEELADGQYKLDREDQDGPRLVDSIEGEVEITANLPTNSPQHSAIVEAMDQNQWEDRRPINGAYEATYTNPTNGAEYVIVMAEVLDKDLGTLEHEMMSSDWTAKYYEKWKERTYRDWADIMQSEGGWEERSGYPESVLDGPISGWPADVLDVAESQMVEEYPESKEAIQAWEDYQKHALEIGDMGHYPLDENNGVILLDQVNEDHTIPEEQARNYLRWVLSNPELERDALDYMDDDLVSVLLDASTNTVDDINEGSQVPLNAVLTESVSAMHQNYKAYTVDKQSSKNYQTIQIRLKNPLTYTPIGTPIVQNFQDPHWNRTRKDWDGSPEQQPTIGFIRKTDKDIDDVPTYFIEETQTDWDHRQSDNSTVIDPTTGAITKKKWDDTKNENTTDTKTLEERVISHVKDMRQQSKEAIQGYKETIDAQNSRIATARELVEEASGGMRFKYETNVQVMETSLDKYEEDMKKAVKTHKAQTEAIALLESGKSVQEVRKAHPLALSEAVWSRMETTDKDAQTLNPTKDSTMIMAKRALADAIEQGKTRVAWTTPEQQADRYAVELARDSIIKVTYIEHNERGEGVYKLKITDRSPERVTLTELGQKIGQGAARNIARKMKDQGFEQSKKMYTNTADDFAYAPVGKGMIHQYAVALPKAMEELLKPYLGKKGSKAKWGKLQDSKYADNKTKDAEWAIEYLENEPEDVTIHELWPEKEKLRALFKSAKYSERLNRGYYTYRENPDTTNPAEVKDIVYSRDELIEYLKTYVDTNPYIDIPEKMVEDYRNSGFSRYNLQAPERDLIAVSNMDSEYLPDVLYDEGLYAPSVAVTKKGVAHSSFGDISFILDKSAIDPKNKKNLAYPRDAYTKRKPRKVKVFDRVPARKVVKDLEKLPGADLVESYWDVPTNDRDINNLASNTNVQNAYIIEKYGKKHATKPVMNTGVDALGKKNPMAKALLKWFGPVSDHLDIREKLVELGEDAETITEEFVKVYHREQINHFKDTEGWDEGTPEQRREHMEYLKDHAKALILDSNGRFTQKFYNILMHRDVYEAIKEAQKGTGTINHRETKYAVSDKLRELNGFTYHVEEWLKDKFADVSSKSTFYSQKEGKDKNWTPRNVVKEMYQEDQRGTEGGFGLSHPAVFAVKALDPFRSLEEMRKRKDTLQELVNFDHYGKDLEKVLETLAERRANDGYIPTPDREDAAEALIRYKKHKSVEQLEEDLYALNMGMLSLDDMDIDGKPLLEEIQRLFDTVETLPTQYFEAKPQRMVTMDEIATAVVPSSTDSKLVKRLREDFKVDVQQYKDQDHRQEIIDGMTDKRVRFNMGKDEQAPEKKLKPQKPADTKKAKKIVDDVTVMREPQSSVYSAIQNLAKNLGIVGYAGDEVLEMVIDPGSVRSEKVKAKAVKLQAAVENAINSSEVDFDSQDETIGEWVNNSYDSLKSLDLVTGQEAYQADPQSQEIQEAMLLGELPDYDDYDNKVKAPAGDMVRKGTPRLVTFDGEDIALRDVDGYVKAYKADGTVIEFDHDQEIYVDAPVANKVKKARDEKSHKQFVEEMNDIMENSEPGSQEYEEAFNSLIVADIQPVIVEENIQAAKEEAVAQARKSSPRRISPQTEMDLDQKPDLENIFDLPAETRKERLYRAFVDRFDIVKRLEDQIKDKGGRVKNSVYQALELNPGRADEAIAKIDRTADAALKIMVKEGITPEMMTDFLYAQHAKERNVAMAAKNDGVENLSGMSDKTADDIMEAFEKAGLKKSMERIFKLLQAERVRINKDMVKNGIRPEETQDSFDDAYKYYVPLKGSGDPMKNTEGSKRSKGMQSKDTAKTALGRTSRAQNDILATYLSDMAADVVQVEKAKVGASLLKLIRDNPNPSFWQIDPPRTKKVFNKKEDRVVEQADPYRNGEPNVFVTREDGEQRVVVFNTPEGQRLAMALNGMDQGTSNIVFEYLGKLNRYLGSVLTSYNPPFVISNALRDAQTALYNIKVEQDSKTARKTGRGAPAAMRAIYRDSRGKDAGKWGEYWQEMQDSGGKTGFAAVPNVEQKLEEFQDKYDMASSSWSKAPSKKVKKAWIDFLDLIEDANTSVENALRLSYYRALREAGFSKDNAASEAKNLTVNFNRKGQYGSDINKLFLFFNAAVQGSDRIYQSYKKNPKNFAKLAATLSGFGFSLGIYNQLMGGEDEESGVTYWEKVADYTKASNFVFMIPGGEGKHIKIPMPYGHNALVSAGYRTADLLMNPRSDKVEQAFGIANDIIGAANPLGSSGNAVNMISPTVTDMMIEIDRNKNFAGSPIYREPSPMAQAPQPNSQMGFRSTGAPFVGASKLLNKMTGGDEEISGKIDINPDILEHLWDGYTGGTGKFFKKTYETMHRGVQGEFEPSKTPFVSKVYGGDNEYYDQSQFYNTGEKQMKKILQRGNQPKNRAKRLGTEAHFAGDTKAMQEINIEAGELAEKSYGYVVLSKMYQKLKTGALPRMRKGRGPKEEQAILMQFFNKVKNKIIPLQNELDKLDDQKSERAKKIRKAIDKVLEIEQKRLQKKDAKN